MQGERSSLDSFPETVDLNQGSIPNDSSVDHSASWDNLLNPVQDRLSGYMVPSSGSNISSTNAVSSRAQSFSGWAQGESSSSANNSQDRTYDHSKMRLGWSSSFGHCSETDARTDNLSFEASGFSNSSYVGNQVTGILPTMQNYSSIFGSQDATSSHGPARESDSHGILGATLPHNLYKSGQSEAVKTSNFYASSSIAAASGSSSSFFEINNASGSSTGPWGSSCKRKNVEGNSGQFCHGGSSSSNQPVENMKQNPIHGCYSSPRSLSISSEPLNSSLTIRSEQLNSRGVGMSRATPATYPSSVPGIPESSGRNPVGRSNTRHHDLVRFDAARGIPLRRPTAYATQPLPRPFSSIESLELRSPVVPPINPGNTLNQSHILPASEDLGTHPYPWNRSFSTRGGSFSRSSVPSGERGPTVHDDVNARSSIRNNPDFPMLVSVPETRNVPQDQIDWSFAPGTSTSSRNPSFASRIGAGSGARASPVILLPHQMQRSQAHQRFSEFYPWNPTQRIESDSGVRRSPFVPFPSASFSADEAPSTSLGQHQSDQQPPAFSIDTTSDDASGWNALAAVEGRHRLQIRQVLNAMRRGVHLQPEDYMLIDPFINGFVEMHDRHRDMRLDVDNMSYEELLALEERIGNVNTGLSEEKILASMKQRKYRVFGVALKLEPCCICQEEYMDGDNIGISDCGHEFHVNCIKQWLTLKNLCPICKTTALEI
ncbi:E3 ubiquitin-protein ligase MBR2-like isoform X1 [Primulina eburnea]|uniref:E3 ubiquitin-protein ligase MBR2-like isoform X1 n=1 Tax=Primulina eburnea TaxID=1245227 RepID=UPI003C6C6C66